MFPSPAVWIITKLVALKNRNVFLTVVEARFLQPSCWQEWFLLEALRKNTSQASLLALLTVGNPWCSLACRHNHSNPSLCLSMVIPLCVSVFVIWTFQPFGLRTHPKSRSYKILGWMTHKLESRLPGETSTTSDMQIYHFNGRKWRGTKEPLDEGEREEVKKLA